jgi:hypothetical protein
LPLVLIKLVELISRPEVKSISTESGVNYQIELNVFWDSQPEKDLRIMGSRFERGGSLPNKSGTRRRTKGNCTDV